METVTPAKTEVAITGATHLIAINNNTTYFAYAIISKRTSDNAAMYSWIKNEDKRVYQKIKFPSINKKLLMIRLHTEGKIRTC